MKTFAFLVLILSALFFFSPGRVGEVSVLHNLPDESLQGEPFLDISLDEPLQGEPVLIRVGLKVDSIVSIELDDTSLEVFDYGGFAAAIYGFDLKTATGTRDVKAVLEDGRIISKELIVRERGKYSAPLGIPAKLGGDTPQSQTRLVSSLGEENKVLSSLVSVDQMIWREDFGSPLASTIVTDSYGYSRQTGPYEIVHKGTDFRAATGTSVFAMNDAVVSLAREFKIYGKTLVLDHGLGLETMYMHLSETKVAEGEKVVKGQVIALSGDTGYAGSPHLHLSVRIKGVSIDPMVFLSLFK